MFCAGSRKSNSGSSRAGSGLSVMSDHRPSPDRRPISGRNDYQGTIVKTFVELNHFSYIDIVTDSL